MRVMNVSHNDLDGFASSVVVEDYLDHQQYVGSHTYCNVGYHELETALENNLSSIDVPLDWLIITDLNIGPRIINILLNNTTKYKHFTLIDHHNNDEALLSTLRESLDHEGIGCDIVITKGVCATSLLYNFLMVDGELETGAAPINAVNAWDVHDFSDWEEFLTGQLLNDIFYEVFEVFRPVLSEGLFNWVMNRATRLLLNPNLINTGDTYRDIESEFKFDLPERLLEEISNISPEVRELVNHYALTSTVVKRSFHQALAVLAAFLAMPTEKDEWTYVHQFDSGETYRFHYANNGVTFGVIHHWLYTLECFDAVALRRGNKGVSLRQNDANGHVDLSQMARTFHGGGHHGSASIPESGVEAMPIARDTVSNALIRDTLFTYLHNFFEER